MKQPKGFKSLRVEKEDNYISLSINPKIYPLDILFTVCYIFLEDDYILLDGDKNKEVIVRIKPKQGNKNLEEIAGEFLNQLITYSVYKTQLEQNKDIKNAIIKKVLLTNIAPCGNTDGIAGISLPWEKKKASKNDN